MNIARPPVIYREVNLMKSRTHTEMHTNRTNIEVHQETGRVTNMPLENPQKRVTNM